MQGKPFAIGVQDSEIIAAGRSGIGEAARHGADRHHEDVAFIRAADVVVARWWGGRLLRSRGLLWIGGLTTRSEERRVGKECRSRWSPYH